MQNNENTIIQLQEQIRSLQIESNKLTSILDQVIDGCNMRGCQVDVENDRVIFGNYENNSTHTETIIHEDNYVDNVLKTVANVGLTAMAIDYFILAL